MFPLILISPITSNVAFGVFDDDINDKSLVKCCSNVFCFKCINIWLASKNVCPLCKTKLNTDDLYLIRDNEDDTENIIIDETLPNKEFDKLKNLEILLKNKDPNSKFLIFSEFDISFDRIIDILQKTKIWGKLK